MIESRALKTLLVAASAILLGWHASYVLATPRPNDGWALAGAAALLYVAALGGKPLTRVPAPAPGSSAPVPRLRRPLIAFSIASGMATLAFFGIGGRDAWGWALHLVSLGALVLAALPFGAIGERRLASPRRSLERLLLVAIVLGALAIRLWQNDSIPPGLYYDEAREGVIARRILAEPSYRPVYIPYIERPAHHAYLIALSFAVFGDNVAALRLVPALFGAANVLAAYLLFGRWLGRGGGLLAAALWAVMRYDITFSRIVFDGNSTPFFVMLTLYFLDRARASRRASDFALAGLVLGIGQGFYLPMRLFAALLAAIGVVALAGSLWRARSFAVFRPVAPALAAFALAMLLATAPIIQFALANPGIFFDRNVTASIFAEHDEPDLLRAIANSTVAHLGMYNFQGDRNGRHNLPLAPMLDPLSGALFLLGLALALRRCSDAPNRLMLLLFGAMLLGGILSTDLEAPHALRSIGALPSVIYFVTLALAAPLPALARARAWLSASRMPWSAAAALPALALAVWAVIAWSNLDLYFNRQAVDPLVWRAHSPAEVWTASEMNRLGSKYAIVLSERYRDAPTIPFLAPAVAPARYITGTDALPLDLGAASSAVLFLDSSLAGKVEEARRAYPGARVRELRAPDGGDPILTEIIADVPRP